MDVLRVPGPAQARLLSVSRDVLISIAAGPLQLPLLHSARSVGLGVVALDREPEAVGFALSDATARASTHDADAALEAILETLMPRRDLRPVAVATKSSGPPVTTTAVVARELGLRGLHPQRARELETKPGQLQLAGQVGLRVPARQAVDRLDELLPAGIGFPLVCKPAETVVGKRGVALVRDRGELSARFAAARAASRDGRCEVESFLEGEDLVVCALFQDSLVTSFLEMDEDTRFLPSGNLRGYGLNLPSKRRGSPVALAARSLVQRFVGGLELGCGFGLWTFRAGKDHQPALLEVHLDLAGDLVTDVLLPRALGADPIELALMNLLGRTVHFPEPERAVAVRFLFAEDQGPLSRLQARDWADLDPVGGGPVYPGSDANRERIGHVILERPGVEELLEAVDRLDRLLHRSLTADTGPPGFPGTGKQSHS